MRAITALLPLGLASLALSKAIPDREPVKHTLKPTHTKTCRCPRVTEGAKLKRSDDDIVQNCLTMDVVDGIIDDYTYLMTQPGRNPDVFNATAEKLLTDDFMVLSESILTLGNIPVSLQHPSTSMGHILTNDS